MKLFFIKGSCASICLQHSLSWSFPSASRSPASDHWNNNSQNHKKWKNKLPEWAQCIESVLSFSSSQQEWGVSYVLETGLCRWQIPKFAPQHSMLLWSHKTDPTLCCSCTDNPSDSSSPQPTACIAFFFLTQTFLLEASAYAEDRDNWYLQKLEGKTLILNIT